MLFNYNDESEVIIMKEYIKIALSLKKIYLAGYAKGEHNATFALFETQDPSICSFGYNWELPKDILCGSDVEVIPISIDEDEDGNCELYNIEYINEICRKFNFSEFDKDYYCSPEMLGSFIIIKNDVTKKFNEIYKGDNPESFITECIYTVEPYRYGLEGDYKYKDGEIAYLVDVGCTVSSFLESYYETMKLMEEYINDKIRD